jgi:hypothetical protein
MATSTVTVQVREGSVVHLDGRAFWPGDTLTLPEADADALAATYAVGYVKRDEASSPTPSSRSRRKPKAA